MKRKTNERFGAFSMGLAVGLATCLVFAVSWGRGEYDRGRLRAERDFAVAAARYAVGENVDLRQILTDREAMETFMLNQYQAYSALLDAFYRVKPRMPEGAPADPVLRKKALEYYREHGKPWPGPQGEDLEDAGAIPTEEVADADD